MTSAETPTKKGQTYDHRTSDLLTYTRCPGLIKALEGAVADGLQKFTCPMSRKNPDGTLSPCGLEFSVTEGRRWVFFGDDVDHIRSTNSHGPFYKVAACEKHDELVETPTDESTTHSEP